MAGSVKLKQLAASGATNGQIPIFNTVTGLWEPHDVPGNAGGCCIQSLAARIEVDTSTSSAVFVDLLTINITTVLGSRLLMVFLFSLSNGSANQTAAFRFMVDGIAYDGSGSRLSPANEPQSGGMQRVITGLAAGAHVVKVQWKTSGGTISIKPVTVPDTESAALEVTELT